MFYELIHTRCKQGVDIKKGVAVSGEGFKEYACSPELMKDNFVDIPLFAEMVKGTSSYVDRADASKFMEDAYFYCAPDYGVSFMINFHPIPWEKEFEAQGRFMNRPGNFVNHVFAGDFAQADFYTYELFGDANWDAKKKGYSYYYDEPPKVLDRRTIKPNGKYSASAIAAFVKDGREEAVMKAVAFLIDQSKCDPKERKYLVIKDTSSENIEMWIAAIQSAFSPRIAAHIPFATRMDKFNNSNKYTVNQDGRYQTQMNLQDPRQSHRYRAIIVGVDERDKSNVNVARPMANSPFALLDGKEKKAGFETGSTSGKYFRTIVSFGDEHKKFCREFLQTWHISQPNEDLTEFFACFETLRDIDRQSPAKLAEALNVLDRYKADKTETFIGLCNSLERSLPRLLQQDLIEALGIVTWLKKSASVTGDRDISAKLIDMVCESFEDLVFRKGDLPAALRFWKQLQNSEFAKDLAGVITDKQMIANTHEALLNRLNASEWVIFFTIFLEGAKALGSVSSEAKKQVGGLCLYGCYKDRDKKSLDEAVKLLEQDKYMPIFDLILSIANKMGDNGFSQFLVNYLVEQDKNVASSDETMMAFCKKLITSNLGHLSVMAIRKRFNALRLPEYARFLGTLGQFQQKGFIDDRGLADLIEKIDRGIAPESTDKVSLDLATKLLGFKPAVTECSNAAHVYALSVFSEKANFTNFLGTLKLLEAHGFPSVSKDQYVNSVVKKVASMPFRTKNEEIEMLGILGNMPDVYIYAYAAELSDSAKKSKNKWCALMDYAAGINNTEINAALLNALIDMEHSEKSLTELYHLLPGKLGEFYWYYLAEEALVALYPKKARKKATEDNNVNATRQVARGGQRSARNDNDDIPQPSNEAGKKGLLNRLFGSKKDNK